MFNQVDFSSHTGTQKFMALVLPAGGWKKEGKERERERESKKKNEKNDYNSGEFGLARSKFDNDAAGTDSIRFFTIPAKTNVSGPMIRILRSTFRHQPPDRPY